MYDQYNLQDHPELIFNLDETGYGKEISTSRRVLAPVGTTHVRERIEFQQDRHTSVAMCVCADGTYIPPMVIYTGNLPPEPHGHNYKTWGPQGAHYVTSPRGHMTEDIFIEFIHHIDRNLGRFCPAVCP
jgi:hypothetical protein